MAWSGSVIRKGFAEGGFEVVVQYTDGVRVQHETYRAVQPDANWVPRLVRDRLAMLESASAFDVPTGAVVPAPAPVTLPPEDATLALFRRRMQ